MARAQSLREAGRRYQASKSGRLKHAARQCDYRARQTIVTHHGSPPQASDDLLTVIPTLQMKIIPQAWHCHFCAQLQAQFVRHRFLQCRIRRPLRSSDRSEPHHDPDP